MNLEVSKNGTISSLELLKEINFWRVKESEKLEEGKTDRLLNKLEHKNLLSLIRDEFKEEIDELELKPTTYLDKSNRKQPCFNLTLSQAKRVLLKESKYVRRAIIKSIEKTILELQKKEEKYINIIKPLENITFNGNIEGLVYNKNGKPITTSRIIADYTGKEHYNVLRDIRNEIKEIEDINSNLNTSIIINDFKENKYLDMYNREQIEYELGELATMQILLKYSTEHRARFIIAFRDIKIALFNMFKAKLIDSVLPQDNRLRQYVYILKNPLNETVKIGVAQDVDKRIKQLQTGAGIELELIYKSLVCSNAFSIEKDVHSHFENNRTFGEWFKINESEVIEFLEQQSFVLRSEFLKNIENLEMIGQD